MLEINIINGIVIFVGILGLFHYGGIFSMPGQIIFAYFIAAVREIYRR
jgi:hypothetical protein